MNTTLLIVEDEPAIRELVSVNARHAGFDVRQAGDARSARICIDAQLPDLVILDWMLPDTSGIELAQQLRRETRTRRLPILMLTARAEEADTLAGFAAGADDYLTKPFSPRELIARIQALLRRSAPEAGDAPIEIGGLRLEPDTFRVSASGKPVELSPTEFKLLHYLMSHPDRVLSRARLLDGVWGDHVFIEERTVDVHIRRLRLALQPSGLDRRIETVRGGGYRILPD